MATLISSREGLGFRSSSAVALMSMPGVQKPHWPPPPRSKQSTSGSRCVALAERLHRLHVAPVGVERERQAREHRAAVEDHRAGAAVALVAALLGAVEVEVVAERFEQRAAGVDGEIDRQAPGAAPETKGERHQALGGGSDGGRRDDGAVGPRRCTARGGRARPRAGDRRGWSTPAPGLRGRSTRGDVRSGHLRPDAEEAEVVDRGAPGWRCRRARPPRGRCRGHARCRSPPPTARWAAPGRDRCGRASRARRGARPSPRARGG